jgi:tetratricopeptide (TPR) repeat protein
MAASAAWAGLVLLGVLLYAPSLRFDSFHYDDANVIVDNPAVRTLADPARFFTDPRTGLASTKGLESGSVGYRPILTLSFAIDHALWGVDARGFRATNLLIHVAMGLAVFGLALAMGVDRLAAWLAAAAMLIHPAHVQVVDYVSARSSSLGAALTVAAAWAYVEARNRESSRWYAASLAAGACALLSKESAVVLPGLLLVAEMAAPSRTWRDVNWRALAPFALLVGVFLWFRFVALNPVNESAPPLDRAGWLAVGWTAARIAAAHAWLWVWPWPLALDHAFAVSGPSWDFRTVLVAAAWAAGAAGAAGAWWGLARGPRIAAFGVCWFVVALLPSCALPWITTRGLLFEHRAYVANVGLAVLTAWGGAWLYARTRAPRRISVAAGLAAVGLVWSALTVAYAETWKTPMSAWAHAVRVEPNSMTAHYSLGRELRAAGRDAEALVMFERARALNPVLKDIQDQIEAIRGASGRWTEVIARHEAMVREDPAREFAWFNLGVAYQKVGARDQALAAYGRAIALVPTRAASYVNSGAILLELQRTNEAIAALERAIAIDPSSVHARYNLAGAYRTAGRLEDAKTQYRELLGLVSDQASGEGLRASVEIALRELERPAP